MSQTANSEFFVDACYCHGLIAVSLYEIQNSTEEYVCYFSNAANALNYAFLLKKRHNRPIAKRAMELIMWEVRRTNAVSTRAQLRAAAKMEPQPSEDNVSTSQESVPHAQEESVVNEVISDASPMSQFKKLKKKHPDAVLLMRVGDFYECFAEDAEVAADILGITLTRRKKGKESIALAGFPHHALDTYLPKLVRAGKRVAICEPLADI